LKPTLRPCCDLVKREGDGVGVTQFGSVPVSNARRLINGALVLDARPSIMGAFRQIDRQLRVVLRLWPDGR
jgi:hypothetical protein